MIEVVLFQSGLAESMTRAMLGVSWLLVLGGFIVVGWIASSVAAKARSIGAQYAALAGFVLAEAIIFVPMLFIANEYAEGNDPLGGDDHDDRLRRADRGRDAVRQGLLVPRRDPALGAASLR